jgi:hypothetical protein
MPVVPKKRQSLTAAKSKSRKTDHTSHHASEGLESGDIDAKVETGFGLSGGDWVKEVRPRKPVAQ